MLRKIEVKTVDNRAAESEVKSLVFRKVTTFIAQLNADLLAIEPGTRLTSMSIKEQDMPTGTYSVIFNCTD
jgi:hypothetical protein